MLIVAHARNGAFLQDLHPKEGRRGDNAGFSFFTGVYDFNFNSNLEDVRESTFAQAKLSIAQAEMIITGVFGAVNEGADFVFTLADALDNGIQPRHLLAALPFFSLGMLRALDGLVDIGGGMRLCWTDELADAFRKIPDGNFDDVLRLARTARNSDEAYDIIIRMARRYDAPTKAIVAKVADMRHPRPDTLYASHGYFYRTDKHGRLAEAFGELRLGPGQRNESAQRTVGRSSGQLGDDGGHIIARMFDGPGEGRLHMVPQGRKLNRDAGSQWTAMEREWKAHLTRGDKVYVNIQIDWPPGAKRPNEFNVIYEITDSVTGAKELLVKRFPNPTL